MPRCPGSAGEFAVAVSRFALGGFPAIVPASLGDVHFATDDGFDAARLGRVVERLRREQIAVIGDGDGRHLPARCFVDDFFEIARSIQKTVIRMQMQVNESGGFHAGCYSSRAREILATARFASETRIARPIFSCAMRFFLRASLLELALRGACRRNPDFAGGFFS